MFSGKIPLFLKELLKALTSRRFNSCLSKGSVARGLGTKVILVLRLLICLQIFFFIRITNGSFTNEIQSIICGTIKISDTITIVNKNRFMLGGKMKLLIHNNEITFRGDATNTQNVALMLKGVDVQTLVVVPRSVRNHESRINEMRKQGIDVIDYVSSNDLRCAARDFGVTHSMFVHDGRYRNDWIPDTRLLIHAVFNNYEPYGDVYAYVSRWLYNQATKDKNGRNPDELESLRNITNSPYRMDRCVKTTWVPHTVMPKVGDGFDFRRRHKISSNAFLIGRIGGYTEFNDSEAKKAVLKTIEKHKDVRFVFVNTRPFALHQNIKYLGYITESEKWDFYDACDLLLNARLMGESFGFSIVEPLMLGKPIIGPSTERNRYMDRHHIEILKPMNLLYRSASDLESKISQIINTPAETIHLRALVDQFTVDKVRQRFFQEFLL